MEDLKQGVYNFNYKAAEVTNEIPLIGSALLGAQVLLCDYVYDPLSSGSHVGCVGVRDVYHGLPNRLDETGEQAIVGH